MMREFDPARDHGRYILDTDGRTPIPCDDLLTWARWLEKHNRHVAHDVIDLQYEVSTIFTGLDLNIARMFNDKARPHLFETAVFRLAARARIGMTGGGRWSTWDEAEREHARIVAELRKSAAG